MRTWDAAGHPWVPSAAGQAPHGAGGTQGHVAGVALELGCAARGEVLCRFQLSMGDVRDGALSLCGSPAPKPFPSITCLSLGRGFLEVRFFCKKREEKGAFLWFKGCAGDQRAVNQLHFEAAD